MKRTILILVFSLLLGTFSAYSEPVSPSTARSAADTFLSRKTGIQAAKRAQNAFLSGTQAVRDDKGQTIAYVHSFDTGGYVITAADNRITPVLGYSDKGSFNFTDSDQNFLLHLLRIDIPIRLDALEASDKDMLEQSIENNAQWNNLANGIAAAKKADARTYGPLIQTNWNQDFPYKIYCPLDPSTGLRSLAGCTATAVAQICNYWQYPKSITFDAGNAYISNGENGQIAIFEDSEKLDFPGIEDINAELSTIQYNGDIDEIAWFMLGIGIVFKTHYSSDSSGATPFSEYFWNLGFSSAYYSNSWADDHQKAIDNLKNNIPVGFALVDTDISVKHAVVLDGYDESTGMYHINLGYSNQDESNTWYTLPIVNQYDQIMGFIYDIIPDEPVVFEEVSGTIRDSGGAPVNLATVVVNPGCATACTDETGTFRFRLPQNTDWSISVNCPGYERYQGTVGSGENTITLNTQTDPTLAWYRFDGDGSDASGQGNDLIIDQALASFVPGRYGNAVSINALEAVVSAETSSVYYTGSGDLTVETWVQITDVTDSALYLTTSLPGYFTLALHPNYGFHFVAYHIGNDSYNIVSSPLEGRYDIGDWVHIAAVYRYCDSLEFYIDGVLENAMETPLPLISIPGLKVGVGLILEKGLYDSPLVMDESRISAAALQPGEFVGDEFKGSLTVTVSDGESGVLSGAEVTLEPGGYTAQSGEDGLAVFDSLPARDDYTVTVSAEGFDPVTASDIEVATGNGASLTIDITGNNAVGVDNDIPIAFELGNPFPNPFNAGVSINYSLAETSPVELTLYSIGGQVVKKISKGTMAPGRYSESIDSEGLPNGVFFIRLKAGSNSAVKKVVHVK